MKKLKIAIAKTPVVGRVVLFVYRAKLAGGYFYRPFSEMIKWLFRSREVTNFTYDLDGRNIRYMISLISDILSMDYKVIESYVEEVQNDSDLKEHVINATKSSDFKFMADEQVFFGRRIGWYVFARALKPKIIIETGVDKGLGACVLSAAILRNRAEGHHGRYYGTDINPNAGYLFSGKYAEAGSILYGDSIATLKNFNEEIDLFINDSDHSAEYEAMEYETIAAKLSRQAVVLGDNSHCTDKLFNFSLSLKRNFIFFQGKAHMHWYSGGGIGISFIRRL